MWGLGKSVATDPAVFEREFGAYKLSELIKLFQGGVEDDLEVCEVQNEAVREGDDRTATAQEVTRVLDAAVADLSAAWGELDAGLSYVEGKQAALETDMAGLEKSLAVLLEGDVALDGADLERMDLYDLLQGMDAELNMLLRRVTREAGRVGGIYERHISPPDAENPMGIFLRLTNDHQHALEWLQRTARQVEDAAMQCEMEMTATGTQK